jgi:hypothetical protein
MCWLMTHAETVDEGGSRWKGGGIRRKLCLEQARGAQGFITNSASGSVGYPPDHTQPIAFIGHWTFHSISDV